jgi:hypothetical protein
VYGFGYTLGDVVDEDQEEMIVYKMIVLFPERHVVQGLFSA